MKRRSRLSAFTPSNTDPELLERIFVQRKKLLSAITDRLARSMAFGEKHHVLLIGPRGSGKTNLVTLAEHRLRQRTELSDVMRVAWLGEDDVMVELIDIALAIADRLAEEHPKEFSADPRSGIRALSGDDAAIAVLNHVLNQLKHRNLLVVMENLDRVFAGLGDLGQKRWRAFLQETTRIATLATSQQLFEGVTSRDEAFFGFFDLHHLKPLSVDDASELIGKVAIEQRKLDLVKFLNSSTGRYRVRALHHLAGGNHRMYVLLSEYLTKDSLDDLVESFEQLAEELTPYFQERMRSIPPQQAKLVQCLANSEGARTVKEIAEETFIAERNCSKQLGNLRETGYVISSKRGKESYYELAEPLMRLCLEVKNQRGRPLKLVAKFLKVWFPVSSLSASAGHRDHYGTRGDQYRLAAIEMNNDFEGAIRDGLSKEIRERIEQRDFQNAQKLTEELACVDEPQANWLGAFSASKQGNYKAEIRLLTQLIRLPHASTPQRAKALFNRGCTYGEQGEPELAIADYSALIQIPEAPPDLRAKALFNRGCTYGEQGEPELAIADYSALTQLPDAPAEQRAEALLNRGITYSQQGEPELAIADYSALIQMPDALPDQRAASYNNVGATQWRDGQYQQSEDSFRASLNMEGVSPPIRTGSLFAMPEPMVALHGMPDVIAALHEAFVTGDRNCDAYGGTPGDLLGMILRRGQSEWKNYAIALVPLFEQHGVAEKLGKGIVESIGKFDGGDYSNTQLNSWNSAWQEAGQKCSNLELPLRCLAAATEVLRMKDPSDRPLFKLPLEIRGIVRGQLTSTLGPTG